MLLVKIRRSEMPPDQPGEFEGRRAGIDGDRLAGLDQALGGAGDADLGGAVAAAARLEARLVGIEGAGVVALQPERAAMGATDRAGPLEQRADHAAR